MPTVALDANFLSILLDDKTRIPADPSTQRPFERAQERIQYLIEELQDKNAKILIPTPALAEFLILAYPDGAAYLQHIKSTYRFELVDFDEMAAIELAELAVKIGKPKRKPRVKRDEETWAKLKYDRQILAISLAHTIETLYSADGPLRELAKSNGINVVGLADLPMPPPKQMPLLTAQNVVSIAEAKDGGK